MNSMAMHLPRESIETNGSLIFMSAFPVFCTGVSCDACLKSNFSGLRYKCLVCYDYDLCATCYSNGATSSRHTADHAMQCILTRADISMQSPVTLITQSPYHSTFHHFLHFVVLYPYNVYYSDVP